METTFQEAVRILASSTAPVVDLAILRTTPALLGLFSLVTVWAHGLTAVATNAVLPNRAAWYKKRDPTFSDAIAAVRRLFWAPPDLSMSRQANDTIKMPVRLVKRFVEFSASPCEMRKVEVRRGAGTKGAMEHGHQA